jgi:DNA modification methylase
MCIVSIYRKSEIPDHLQQWFEPAELGLESTPEEYVSKMVAVFREVRRVLRNDGVLFLNLGDSYFGSWGAQSRDADDPLAVREGGNSRRVTNGSHPTLKPKDLVGIPWRVAFALQADGWYLRSDIIWAKSNPMPESVTDRPTKAHEYVFLMAKSARYYYDADAISEISNSCGPRRDSGGGDSRLDLGMYSGRAGNRSDGTRNARTVWTIATEPYPEAHFATFPTALAERCIRAGSRTGDTVLDPFAGSGTVGQVARGLGRSVVLIELNPEYVRLIEKRCTTPWERDTSTEEQRSLFDPAAV